MSGGSGEQDLLGGQDDMRGGGVESLPQGRAAHVGLGGILRTGVLL